MNSEDRRTQFARRRRMGLIVGGILAFVFGGWPGLFAALMVAALARFVEAWAFQNARPGRFGSVGPAQPGRQPDNAV